MNITKQQVDSLNAIVKIEVAPEDYQSKVNELLENYRKGANIPGFRKGKVPMGMIKKQYEKPAMIDEINKLIQESLNQYINDEKLSILGNPLPVVQEDFSWDQESFEFEFELGLAPEFDIDLKAKNKVVQFDIEVDASLLDKEVENLQKRYGKMINHEEVIEGANVTGEFVNEEKEIANKATIRLEDIKGKINLKKFLGSKADDVLELKTKNLFNDEQKLMAALGLSKEEVEGLEIPLTFKIENISSVEPAELNQELFDKIFGEGNVSSEEELREKIKADAKGQFDQQADQYLLNQVTEHFIETSKFDLPAAFLKKWLRVAGEKELTEEEAAAEYEKSEKGLRYQLIEGNLVKANDIKIDFEELKNFTVGYVKNQMAQYGNLNPEEKELEDIANRVLTNQDEAKRLQDQLVSQKLLDLYKDNMTFKTKKVSYEDFIKEAYKQ